MRIFGAVTVPDGAALAVPVQPDRRSAAPAAAAPAGRVRDLRGLGAAGPRRLEFAAGDLVVVSGLPGSGKSTLMKRAVTGPAIDSQDVRERWEARLPGRLPYGLYRPAVRVAHYAGLWAALRSGRSVVVHDCGTQAWVRRLLGRAARRRGRSLHLLLLDASAGEALSGQAARGRGVSAYAFTRHRRAVAALLAAAESAAPPAPESARPLAAESARPSATGSARLPAAESARPRAAGSVRLPAAESARSLAAGSARPLACATVTLLDRPAAARLTSITFLPPPDRPATH